MAIALQALYQEHQSIAAVLHALQHLLREVRSGTAVDTRVFRQILYYLDVFPERFHHPKEDELLFRAIKARTTAADAVIARLQAQHEAGPGAIRQVEQALLRWEAGGAAECEAFAEEATAFVARYREHIRLEEDELMPLARQALAAEDWAPIEAAFAEHRDPIQSAAGASPEEMFRRILHLAPPPIGLGPSTP